MLSIQEYNILEIDGRVKLSNRFIRAFRPKLFENGGFPTTVKKEEETTKEETTTEETTVSEVETTSENTAIVTDEPEVTEVENLENLADEKEAE